MEITPRRLRETGAAYLLLAPALILLAVWFAYPIVSSVLLSFEKVNIFHYSQRQFIALANYRSLFADPVFGSTIRITITFVLLVVPAQTILALTAALIVNGTRRGRTFFRTAFFIPYVTSTVAVTAVFMDLFTVGHPLPRLLALVGFPDTSWYASVTLALPFIALIYVWMNIGLYMVIFLSGLQSIAPELSEAAMVDGADRPQIFWRITLPLLRPFTFFVLVSGIIQAFQVFDQAYVVSGGTVLGGPAGATSTIVIYIFAEAFRYNRLGTASSAAVILLVIVSTATAILRSIFREEAAVAR